MLGALPSSGFDAIFSGAWLGPSGQLGAKMRWLIAVLIVLIVVLQYRLWVGEGSLADLHSIRQEIALQEAEIKQLQTRNQELQAEVEDLAAGLEAVEDRARSELGMIKPGEIFIQVIERPKAETGQ